MKSVISKIWNLFDAKERIYLLMLYILILGGACLEVVGIGMVLPVVALLSNSSLLHDNIYLHWLYSLINPASRNVFLIWLGVGLIVIYLFKNLYLLAYIIIQSRFMRNKHLQLSSKLFRTYLYKPYTFHLQRNSAQLLRNLTIISSLIQGIVFQLITIVTELTIILAIFLFIMWADPLTSILVSIAIVLLMGIFHLIFRKKLKQFGEIQKFYSGKMIQMVNQGIGSIKETKTFGKESFFDEIYHDHLRKTTKAFQYHQIISQAPRYYIETIVVSLVLLTMIFYLAGGVKQLSILTTLTLFAVAAVRLMPSMGRITTALTSIRFYTPSLEEVYEDLTGYEVTPRIVDSIHSDSEAISFQTHIELKNITYYYDSERKAALKDISLIIPKNSTVGFVGYSGGGKTTLVDIILGLLKPTDGYILVDHKDIHTGLHLWQRHIGYIPQSIYLMDDTIKNNVAFGIPPNEINEDKVWEALRMAQLEQTVAELPDGLETLIGENGVRLSRGQQQRIGIARALYHNPSLLVMDEATAALDNETEKDFLESLQRLRGEKTIIIIAHRLNTVQDCDTIFLLRDGCLKASGTYHELLNHSQEFRELAGAGKIY